MSEDPELEILLEAFRLTKGRHMPKRTWSTWNFFVGGFEEHEETDEAWTLRILRQARENVKLGKLTTRQN